MCTFYFQTEAQNKNHLNYFIIFIECNFLFSTIFSESYHYKLWQFWHNQQVEKEREKCTRGCNPLQTSHWLCTWQGLCWLGQGMRLQGGFVDSAHQDRAWPWHKSPTSLSEDNSSSAGHGYLASGNGAGVCGGKLDCQDWSLSMTFWHWTGGIKHH